MTPKYIGLQRNTPTKLAIMGLGLSFLMVVFALLDTLSFD